MANFSNLIFQYIPGKSIKILAFSTSIEKYFDSFKESYKIFENSFDEKYYFSFEIEIRKCLQGEIYMREKEM